MSASGPAWDLSTEYPSPESPLVQADIDACERHLVRLAHANVTLTQSLPALVEGAPDAVDIHRLLEAARGAHIEGQAAARLLNNILTYANCRLSVNGNDDAALALQGRLQQLETRLAQARQPLEQFVTLGPDPMIASYLDDDRTRASTFLVTQRRKTRDELLPLDQENLITELGQDGIRAWSKLYTQLSATLQCEVLNGNTREQSGLASTAGKMLSANEGVRRSAWTAINDAWSAHDETCAAALNAIAGWRLSLYQKRGIADHGARHFLSAPAHQNRISPDTLDALMSAAKGARSLARRAALVQARAYGKSTYGPWDNRAPSPINASDASITSFDSAINVIREAYAQIAPEMGTFVDMMVDKQWIEGTVGDQKRPGAYCTSFAKTRTPRVYMTYTGGDSDVITLAHELGHAYHGWVMRDLEDSERSYGMSLAETASTFGEAAVREALLERATDERQAFSIAWQDAEAAVAFLLNIPARFDFECALYEKRAERPLRPDELRTLMSNAWTDWYGESLSEPDPMFWASKLHFYISGLSFYNFPYLFGYLFSQGVYAKRASLGDDFFPVYQALLRDTGRMTAEAIAEKHLGVDLREPAFWESSLAVVETGIERFERFADSVLA
ncbi:MAG: M3 family oligoendopeptidase [Pseudomonadota bacterium]